MNTNTTKTWNIKISEEEVFSRCTDESLYQAYGRMKEDPIDDTSVIQCDDRSLFRIYYGNALASLGILLARRMEEQPISSALDRMFVLNMHDNHDNNILPILINHCYEYVVKKVLEQWYHADFGSELERLEINHCLHYRKNPVRRRVGPLF